MYRLSQILQGLKDPRFAALHFNRQFADSILQQIRPKTDFFEEDWDNLLILDACRYDMIADVDFEPGTLDYRWSPGSNSEEFVKFHTENRKLDDVIWVTANPWVSRNRENIFQVIDMWEKGWDEDIKTVPPETMRDTALEVELEYPNKRLVVHFMQPHYPFIGKYGQKHLPPHRTFTGGGIVTEETETQNIWEQLQNGDVSQAEVWNAYTENLRSVLPTARKLSNELSGRSVISSDHGNELGKRAIPIPIRIYGHPSGLRTRNLVKVPWIVYEGSDRKKIIPGEMEEVERANDDVLEERLGALGYL